MRKTSPKDSFTKHPVLLQRGSVSRSSRLERTSWPHSIAVDGRSEGDIVLHLSAPKSLRFLPLQLLTDGSFQIRIGTSDGSPIHASRLGGLEVYASADLTTRSSAWDRLNETMAVVNGVAQFRDAESGGQTNRFYYFLERP